jgi:hypothetical protein
MIETDLRLERLLARDEIHQLLLRLARGSDRRDAEFIASCYHEDAFDDHGGFQDSGAEFSRCVPQALAPFAATMHFIGTPHLAFDGDVAHGEAYCQAHHVYPPSDPGGPGATTRATLGPRRAIAPIDEGEAAGLCARP